MATQTVATGDALTVQKWAAGLNAQVLKETTFQGLVGSNSNSIIQQYDELSKGPGDKITVGLRMQLTGAGKVGTAPLVDNEETYTRYTDSFVIEQLRHAHRFDTRTTEQRVNFEHRKEGLLALGDWWSDRWDSTFAYHLCGYTPINSDANADAYRGHNAVVAPDSGSILRPSTFSGAGDEAIDANDVITLDFIRSAVKTAKTRTHPLRTVNVGPYKNVYVCVLDPEQVYQLRSDTAAGGWFKLMEASLQGGRIDDNPLVTGALGVAEGVLFVENTRLTKGVSSLDATAGVNNTRRGLLLGAQACMTGFGQGYSTGRYQWNEETFDYGQSHGIATASIFGVKKTRFNNVDFGCLVLSTYSATA